MSRLLASIVVIALLATSCASVTVRPSPTATLATSESGSPRPSPSPNLLGRGRVDKGSVRSDLLNRTLQYVAYLPPGYDANPAMRYPTVYLLHGGGGDIMEWPSYGVFDSADRLMGDQTLRPYIIVLPEGDQEYWVDHVIDKNTGANGEKWGTYTAREVVPTIDARYRTIARQDARGIGGLSMGGHGAMQLAMNFPGIWSVIGAHSPSIRPEGDAPTYLGFGAEFAARDPLSLVRARPDLARTYAWWIDTGSRDPWLRPTTAIHDQLTALGVAHEWLVTAGDHDAAYWSAHMDDYVRYYGVALCNGRRTC